MFAALLPSGRILHKFCQLPMAPWRGEKITMGEEKAPPRPGRGKSYLRVEWINVNGLSTLQKRRDV